jgi:hypothetical protein
MLGIISGILYGYLTYRSYVVKETLASQEDNSINIRTKKVLKIKVFFNFFGRYILLFLLAIFLYKVFKINLILWTLFFILSFWGILLIKLKKYRG